MLGLVFPDNSSAELNACSLQVYGEPQDLPTFSRKVCQ